MVNLKTSSLNYYKDEVSCVVVKLNGIEEHLDIRKACFSFCNLQNKTKPLIFRGYFFIYYLHYKYKV